MRKNILFVSVFIVFWSLMFISASESLTSERMQNIKTLDLCVKPQDTQAASAVRSDLNFGKLPLYFISNKGQVNKEAAFYAKTSRHTLWLTRDGLVFDSVRHVKVEVNDPGPPRPFRHQDHLSKEEKWKFHRDVSKLMFIGANKNPEMVPIEKSKLRVNYFIGNDKSGWYCDVPTSMAVLYKNLYKHIHLKVYGIEKRIEYNWIVEPGGNPGDIRFEYMNVKGIRLDDQGNLLIKTGFGELVHKKPVIYRAARGAGSSVQSEEREFVGVSFKKTGQNTYGFTVGGYDKSSGIIIAPVVLVYSSCLGGPELDYGYAAAADDSGNVYVTGFTYSKDFPTLNQYQTDQPDGDVFVTKLDTTESGASSLIYSTYLGGENNEDGRGIAVDGSGNVYVTGFTYSKDFPTLNQYQTDQPDGDVFVTKLDMTESGVSSLVYSTYLGGGDWDLGLGIAVDGSGYVYVTGGTYSDDFPTLNQFQKDQPMGDAFVTKLDTTQSGDSSLVYSSYLGGSSTSRGYDIAVDDSGFAYLTGYTSSKDFPTLNQYQSNSDGTYSDAFVTKIDTTQGGVNSLVYSTYLGGTSYDYSYSIAVDGSGHAYVTGVTYSTNFPTLNQYMTDPGDGTNDGFVTRIDTTQSGVNSLVYSTYIGGTSYEYGHDIAVNNSGHAYVTGGTYSTNFPTLNQYMTDPGDSNYDAFVTRIDTTQSGIDSLVYSTYLGGTSYDYGFGIAVDGSGNAYVTGRTRSTDFPTQNQYQTFQGDMDTFVLKLSFGPTNNPPAAVCEDIEVTADEKCEAYITASDVDGGSYDPDEGDEITLSLDNTGPFNPGIHYVELTVTDQSGESDSCFAGVKVKDQSSPVISISAPVCVQIGKGKGKMGNKLSLTVQDNCSDTVDLQILNVEVYNNGGNLVRGEGIFEVMDNDIYVYPNGEGWSVVVTVKASDASGNTASETFYKNLLKCKK